jgi:hypothetical protein
MMIVATGRGLAGGLFDQGWGWGWDRPVVK